MMQVLCCWLIHKGNYDSFKKLCVELDVEIRPVFADSVTNLKYYCIFGMYVHTVNDETSKFEGGSLQIFDKL